MHEPSQHIPSYVSGALFMKAYRVLRQNIVLCLSAYDLIPTSWTLIGIVSQASNGIRLNQVAEELGVKAPLVTNIADELISRGVIDRIPHPTDKRAKLLVITAEGKSLVKRVEQDMQLLISSLLSDASSEDLQSFQVVLESILHNSKLTNN